MCHLHLSHKYEKADLQAVVDINCLPLSLLDQNKLLEVLQNYEDLFDITSMKHMSSKNVSKIAQLGHIIVTIR